MRAEHRARENAGSVCTRCEFCGAAHLYDLDAGREVACCGKECPHSGNASLRRERREAIATAVLAGIVMRGPAGGNTGRDHDSVPDRAKVALQYADALIAALDAPAGKAGPA